MLYDMRVADGKGVGACNLAIDKKLLLEWAGVDHGSREDAYGSEFKECLQGLRGIIWLAHKEQDCGEEEGSPPEWRCWWNVLLASWDVELQDVPKESVLRARHLPEWEQELYRVLREQESREYPEAGHKGDAEGQHDEDEAKERYR